MPGRPGFRFPLAALACAACLLACVPGPPAARADSTIELRRSPLVDLESYLRALAGEGDSLLPSDLPGIAPAVERVRALDRALGSPLAWGALEGNLVGVETAAEARERFTSLPESAMVAPGRKLAIRAEALALADHLAALEPAFLVSVWPEHQVAIDRACLQIERDLLPRQQECFARIEADLGLTPSPEPIPVYLVARSPWPHGVTHRTHQGGGVCWIGADGDSGGLLIETILHEATHALDVRSREGVLAELRARLAASPLQGSPSRQRDIAHTLIFVEAAETVRRVLDPQHIDYGEASGYYARVGRVAEVERTIWRQHLDGRVSREQAIAAIVDSLAPALASPVGQ